MISASVAIRVGPSPRLIRAGPPAGFTPFYRQPAKPRAVIARITLREASRIRIGHQYARTGVCGDCGRGLPRRRRDPLDVRAYLEGDRTGIRNLARQHAHYRRPDGPVNPDLRNRVRRWR